MPRLKINSPDWTERPDNSQQLMRQSAVVYGMQKRVNPWQRFALYRQPHISGIDQYGYFAISWLKRRLILNIQSIGMKDTRRQIQLEMER
jgi:hypothetical protein